MKLSAGEGNVLVRIADIGCAVFDRSACRICKKRAGILILVGFTSTRRKLAARLLEGCRCLRQP
jgi:hypothetical protein